MAIDELSSGEPTRPFDCDGCDTAINSREIHMIENGEKFCQECAADKRPATATT